MNQWEYFWYLFRQGFIAGSMWYLTLFFCLLFILVVYKTFKVDRAPWKKIYLLSLIPFLFPILMLVWGTFFEHAPSYAPDFLPWQVHILSGIFFSQFCINLFCLIYFGGVRLAVAALILLQMYFTLPFYLVAYMSISGSWV